MVSGETAVLGEEGHLYRGVRMWTREDPEQLKKKYPILRDEGVLLRKEEGEELKPEHFVGRFFS